MKKFILLLLLAALVFGVWFWWRHRATPQPAPEPATTATVEVTPLALREIAQTVASFGLVTAAPSSERMAVATFDGVVRRVAVAPGTRVAAGDVLVELALTPDAQLALDSARSAADLAEKNRADTQQRYDLQLATRTELLTTQQAAQDAKLKVASLLARGAGGDGRVLAPVDGFVSKVDATTGAWVAAGTPLAAVTAGDGLEAQLGLEATDATRVAAGQKVTLTSATRPHTAATTTTVRTVGRVVDAVSGAIDARAPLPPGAPFLLGEHVRALIEVHREKALVAPRRALLPDGDREILFTVKDGKAVRHEVHAGVTAGDVVAVSGPDLQAGEPVVTLGNYELEDGMAVHVGPPAADGQTDNPSDAKAPQP
ncbi:efflux RND transporter periplasmic adaptor subunit [Horticoccus luteus]|uniref:Efflux RND transporter periplasmic adaptor subunit n=1 Tax=Horticoccus luteus TaxID=2862869 RepID=A0A8F9TUS2_9BACT|nr:efflux RND transporter periplasmic adaptor subunit [Horticoccus luteus]QYM79649.1 efflux RND transporter periplasmic adaptor subunit [Horticoccus luteus]